jgi:hypothetical protein
MSIRNLIVLAKLNTCIGFTSEHLYATMRVGKGLSVGRSCTEKEARAGPLSRLKWADYKASHVGILTIDFFRIKNKALFITGGTVRCAQ